MLTMYHDESKEFTVQYDEALKLNPGTILQCRSSEYVLIVKANREKNIMIGFFPNPAVVEPGRGYEMFRVTPYDAIQLTTRKTGDL